jgi:RsiW-degrading membrane proteinase PrsW (M82 family)
MEITPLFVLAVAPGIFWLYYFYQKDRCKPEPLALIMRMFILGILITAPAAFIENFISLFLLKTSFFGIFLAYPATLLENVVELVLVVVAAPIVEEFSKFIVVERTVYRRADFDEPIDGIVYATAAALGFATLENIIYVFSGLMMSLPIAVGTGLVRAVLSVPGHALFAVMWGFALGHAKFLPEKQRTRVILGGLGLGILFHGIFNFLVLTNVGFAFLIFLAIPLMWWIVGKKIDLALKECHYNREHEE